MVEIANRGLGVRDVAAVARENAEVRLTDAAIEAMAASAAIVDALADSDEPAYGVSTGFGSLATTPIPADRRGGLPRAPLLPHPPPAGPPPGGGGGPGGRVPPARARALRFSG